MSIAKWFSNNTIGFKTKTFKYVAMQEGEN